MVSHVRPCVITGIVGSEFSVLPISSAMELYKGPPWHFRLEPSDPDFSKTGLTKESFVSADPMHYIGLEKLIRRRGAIGGQLLQRFLKWV